VWVAVAAKVFCNATAALGSNVHCIDLQLVSVSSSQSRICYKGVLSDKVKVKVKVTDVLNFATTLRQILTFGTGDTVTLNGNQISQGETTKHLGIYLDRRLTWQTHIYAKRKQLG
jgi:hypothetical protein